MNDLSRGHGTAVQPAGGRLDNDQRRSLDAIVSGLARGGSLNLVGAACNQLCLFAVVTLVARALGGVDVGEYTLGWACLTVVGLVALWGFQAALTRFVAVHLAEGDAAGVRGTIRFGLCSALGLSVLLAALIGASAHPIADLFHHPAFATELHLVAITLPAATMRDACLAATQGWRSQRAFAVVGWICEPLLRLTLTALAIALGWGLTGAFAAIPVGAWTAAILAAFSLRRRLRTVAAAPPRADVRAILNFSTMSWGIVVASAGLVWADTLILGVLRTAQEVGVYNVATRLVNLAVFVMVPLNAAVSPQFAHLLHRADRARLGNAYSTTTRWILTLSMPAFVLLLVYAHDLLRLFGGEYTVGASVTIILALGQLLNAGTGPCGALLNMSGRVKLNMLNNAAVLVLNIGMNIALIPEFGITGAAVAWSVSLAAVNLARLVEVRVLFGVLPFARASFKVLVAAMTAAVAAIVIHLTIGDLTTRLVVGIACGTLVYGATLWLAGFENDDLLAIRSITRNQSRQVQPS